VNGSHGVYRPGGAALNAGQVGGLRAAMFIARRYSEPPADAGDFAERCGVQIRSILDYARHALDNVSPGCRPAAHIRAEIQHRMTRAAAHIREAGVELEARRDGWALVSALREDCSATDSAELCEVFRNRDMALASAMYLEAIVEYRARGGGSRGSYLVLDPSGSERCEAVGDRWRFSLNAAGCFVDTHILELSVDDADGTQKNWMPIRPVPTPDTWFESVWKAYRDDQVIQR